MTISEQLAGYQVLPVITAQDVESSVELARALSVGGMRAVEITLRTGGAGGNRRRAQRAAGYGSGGRHRDQPA